MVEEKIENLKNSKLEKNNKTNDKKTKVNTKIDLNISLSIPDSYFSSELDKINFYREIETINDLKNLEEIIEDFRLTKPSFPKEAENLFKLLKLKILASNYFIENVKKV
jgi:transcription-repair coupling factor (superfamily II helicase)